MKPNFYINNNRINEPLNWKELSIELNMRIPSSFDDALFEMIVFFIEYITQMPSLLFELTLLLLIIPFWTL